MNVKEQIVKGSIWKHPKGTTYKVLYIANQGLNQSEYPESVVYQGIDNRVWVKTVSNWHDRMVPCYHKPYSGVKYWPFVMMAVLILGMILTGCEDKPTSPSFFDNCINGVRDVDGTGEMCESDE